MSQIAYGYQGFLGAMEEVSWAENLSTISDYFHVRSESINRTDSRIRSDALTALRTVRPSVTGNTTVAGSFESEVVSDNIGWLFKWCLANKNVTSFVKKTSPTEQEAMVAQTGMCTIPIVAGKVFDHIITTNSAYKIPGQVAEYPYYIIDNLDQKGDINSFRVVVGVSEFEKLNTGCKLNSLGLSFGVNEIITASVDTISKDQFRLAANSHTPTLSALDPYVWKQAELWASFYKGTIPIDYSNPINWEKKKFGHINSFEFTVNNNLVGEKWYLGSGRTIDKIPLLRRDITASMEYEFNSPDLDPYEVYKYYTDGHALRNLTIKVIGQEIVDAVNYYNELEIILSQFSIDEASPELSGPEILTQSISGVVEPSNSTPEIIVRIRNTKSNY